MIKYNIFLSLLFIFFLSSCSDKSDYDKYQSCLKKETSDTLIVKDEKCFKKHGKLINGSKITSGQGKDIFNVKGPYFNKYIITNKHIDLISVKNIVLYIKKKNDPENEILKKYILECSYKKIYPNQTATIKCFYDKLNKKVMSEYNKMHFDLFYKNNRGGGWHVGSVYHLLK
tara:strand:- start:40 stop:555 length:516 start_codon:yes stop_codon:yes gene_type:complete